jgi:hypothetical protein
MNISWHDLEFVQEPGEYPFRDGTIIVTFAEMATWKAEPHAQFQLMRRHPLTAAARYALGRRLVSAPGSAVAERVHTSSNGDSWSLTKDPVSGEVMVAHQPNRESGGQVSYVGIDEFMRGDTGAPEYNAIRAMLESMSRLATVLIAYDIHRPDGDHYDKLAAYIKGLGAWWHHLETVWIVKCNLTPAQIRAQLQSVMVDDDQLLIVDITGDAVESCGINDHGTRWLNDNLPAKIVDRDQSTAFPSVSAD